MSPLWGEIGEIVTLDNRAFLRAINVLENDRPSDLFLETGIINKPFFKPVKDNDHFRKLLKEFLEADKAVVDQQQKIAKRSRAFKIFYARDFQLMINELGRLKETRQTKFNDYEMMRRLVCWNNKALERQMTD